MFEGEEIMTTCLDSEKRKNYRSPSIVTFGTVEAKTAGPKSAAADGAPGYQGEHKPHGIAHAQVKIPERPVK